MISRNSILHKLNAGEVQPDSFYEMRNLEILINKKVGLKLNQAGLKKHNGILPFGAYTRKQLSNLEKELNNTGSKNLIEITRKIIDNYFPKSLED